MTEVRGLILVTQRRCVWPTDHPRQSMALRGAIFNRIPCLCSCQEGPHRCHTLGPWQGRRAVYKRPRGPLVVGKLVLIICFRRRAESRVTRPEKKGNVPRALVVSQ